jgi:signal transduction histidine kinase
MALGQSSFRRILLSRLLLLSVPVLLMGVYVTYRKARSAFLETARQNLTESAVRKGESIKQSVEALKNNLASASDTTILKSDLPDKQQVFISQLAQVLPTNIICTQLTDLRTNQITATTCKEPIIINTKFQQQQPNRLLTSPEQIDLKLMLPSTSLLTNTEEFDSNPSIDQLQLWLTAPVYDRQGKLRYSLSVKSAILNQERVEPGSLDGYPVVINQDGIILAHPFIQRVGRNIKQMPDAQRLESLLKNAIAGRPDFLHLFYLEKDGVELVAGYSSIPSPITQDEQEKWIILAVTPLDAALLPLKDIRQVLVLMTFGLIAATSLATLYISRDLARPLEQLRDYSLKQEHLDSTDELPQNFQIREFNQLSIALNEMVARLRAWGKEISSAWKEAKNANQLKSEFLATTSHELRTPLNGIINCIRIVKDGYCDTKEEENEYLQQADDAAIHLLGIINDVLDISKIEAGKLSVTLEQVNLKKIINEVIDLETVPIQKKGLQFTTPIWEEEIFVNADPAKLKQVLLNIVGNAAKFTESGSITIKSEVITKTTSIKGINNFSSSHSGQEKLYEDQILTLDNGELFSYEDILSSNSELATNENNSLSETQKNVIITVKDTGIGIEPSQQDKLFRPFVMVDGSTTRKFGGTGLGLAISRNLIELMGGTINLYSAGENQGTTVTISLPFTEKVANFDEKETHSIQNNKTLANTEDCTES